ncbi:MAG: SH3 domain-containing protein [Rhodovibrio sp.]|nr:SH3 domain-containing protein [Rhodovibrio sp.]
MGTAALVESDSRNWTRYDLPSPVPTVRMMMQQSGCFRVVDRGAASDALQQERALSEQGELQTGSNMGQGQMVAADYLITPRIVFQDANSGGGGAAAGALLPGMVGAVAGAITVQNKEAQTMLAVTNTRTSVQEAIAEGSAAKTDIGAGELASSPPRRAAAAPMSSPTSARSRPASFIDAHNKLARQMGAMTGTGPDRRGDRRTTSDLNMRAGPSRNADVLRTLPEGTEVTPTGQTEGDWWQVEGPQYQGWVSRNYLAQSVSG